MLICIMLALLTKAIVENTMKFIYYPSTIQTYTEYNDNITFPTITVCNNNLVSIETKRG